jgi:peptidoglycan/LPS O-acetylase OafA/YrhL
MPSPGFVANVTPMQGGSSDGGSVLPGPRRIAPLDGIRALAVTAVILYHAEPNWAIGGYLGVDVFFVLSGYLITSLLLREWQGTGGVALRAFWARRARRLLPALFLMLAVVVGVAVAFPAVLGSPTLLGDTLATVGYVANWHLIAAHADYFTASANPSPLLPTWSLAIEEQFYLVWPIILLAVVGGLRHRGGKRPGADGGRRRLAVVAMVAAGGALASATWMAVITPLGSESVNRPYYGSDTRAQGLLIGAALAAWSLWWGPLRSAVGRRAVWAVGVAGGICVVAMWRMVGETSAFAFHGGFALMGLATAAVIACVSLVGGHPLARALAWPPLPYLGRISYGMYLWYFPVLLVVTAPRTHLDGLSLLAVRMAVIVGLASASFHLVETPIRHGALAGWRSWVAVPTAAVTISVLALLVPTLEAQLPSAGAAVRLPFSRVGTPASFVVPKAPVRVLLVGDSMSGSLDVGLSTIASHYGAEVINGGAPGCSLAEGSAVRVLWYTEPPGIPCDPLDPAHLLTSYRSMVRQYDPDVVVYLARSDTLDTELDGTWQHLGQPSFDGWAESRFKQAIAVLSSRGAHVVLMTSPYYQSGEQSDGQPLPENDPARVSTDRRLMAQAVGSEHGVASVMDLTKMLSPTNQFVSDVDGVDVRCTDGIHLTIPGGQWVGERILPHLVSLGRSHAVAASVARRPELPPTALAPPAWYSKLPCAT